MSKIAYITGASSGIGASIAETLARNGYDLILNARRKDRLELLSSKLTREYGIRCWNSSYDIRDREAVKQAVHALPEDFRKINILVNNAGLASGLATLETGDPDDWEVMIDTNIKGLLYITRFLLPLINKDGSGHILNIGSIAGKEVYQNGNVYCSTKHAVDALSKAMRLELSVYPIRVSAIHPGAVETEFSLVRFHGDADRAKAVYAGFDNLIAKDIAQAAWFILSQPQHVNINELVIMPSAQPTAGVIHRKA